MKKVSKVSDEYIIKTVKKHELHMKKANKIYVANTEQQLMSYMKEKGLI